MTVAEQGIQTRLSNRSDMSGRAPADLDAFVETIQRVSQLVTDFPAITELDVNPLVVAPEGVHAVDLRLTVDREELQTGR